jgi:hypothetical protein
VFALWCLRQAGLTDKTWVDGKGFAMGWLPVVQLPEPGDIAYFNRFQHYAIVERCENGRVWLINGNGAGGKVTASDRPISDAALYFSIGRLG